MHANTWAAGQPPTAASPTTPDMVHPDMEFIIVLHATPDNYRFLGSNKAIRSLAE